MEERRLIIVMLLVLVLTFLFMTLSPTTPPQPQKTVQKKPPPAKKVQPPPPEKRPVPQKQGEGPANGRLRNAALQMLWRRDIAGVSSLKLIEKKNERFVYPSPKSKKEPLTLVHPLKNLAPFALLEPQNFVFSSVLSHNKVVFTSQNADITVRKTLQLKEASSSRYDILLRLEIENRTDKARKLDGLVLVAAAGVGRETQRRGFEGAVVGRRTERGCELEEFWVESLDEKRAKEVKGPFYYFGLANKYFAFVLIPESEDVPVKLVRVRRLRKEEKPKNFDAKEILDAVVEVVLGCVELAPKSKVAFEFTVYAGPRDEEVLAVHKAVGLDRLVSYGFFGFLSRIFVAILAAIYWLLPNWGVAIIVLTFIVRGALHPVSRKQQVALIRYQHKLRQIQPELDKIRKKYHKDRRKMNEEIMKLFRKHKVPMVPAGGCFLMLLQIPVFIGLYQALNRSILLRQTSFLWISDLAQPDRLFRLPFTIPLLGTDFFNLLPILTLVVMILQSRFQQSRLATAQQGQGFTYLMYAFLTFILYNLPSGLILYFFASTAVGLVEGWLVRRYIERAHPELVAS
ncbi:MAG: hypothetical protein DRP63_01605 [Planctomycetota bacterium]|nr:MAG: hypothetical protein DRP63_01605 [Planctomycetota bacterium]